MERGVFKKQLFRPVAALLVTSLFLFDFSRFGQWNRLPQQSCPEQKNLLSPTLSCNTQLLQQAFSGSFPKKPETYIDRKAPLLNEYTLISMSMEAGLDRRLLNSLQDLIGEKLLRYAAQVTMTGGLGALMHDTTVSERRVGFDNYAFNPIWNQIKGIVRNPIVRKKTGELELDIPKELMQKIREGVVGDWLREILAPGKLDLQLHLRLSDFDKGNKFRDNTPSERARNILDKEIIIEVSEEKTLYANAPLMYFDAFYYENGKKQYIFDELYPDDPDQDMRIIHMAVFNYATIMLTAWMEKQGRFRNKIIYKENEVFVTLPKELPQDKDMNVDDKWVRIINKEENKIRTNEISKIHVNHTAWGPGVPKFPGYAYPILGLSESIKEDIVEVSTKEDGSKEEKISLVRYALLTADVVTGVSRIHSKVLAEKIFASGPHRVGELLDGEGYIVEDLTTTNGVLFDHWQPEEARKLINHYKSKVGIEEQAPDAEFYRRLDAPGRGDLKSEFKDQGVLLKGAYSLALLIWLAEYQRQDLGGSNWLEEITGYSDVEAAKAMLANYLAAIGQALQDERKWENVFQEFGDFAENLMSNPMISNVRRQVVYKGPQKLDETFDIWGDEQSKAAEELLEVLSDEIKLAAFKKSKTHLIIGGRLFDEESEYRFDKQLKEKVRALGLGSQIAFIENYSIVDAPIIFKGVLGTVMLSDEKMEASSTAMMKALVFFALLLGVLDGAMWELFKIIDTRTGEVIDNLKIGYEAIIRGIEEGRYYVSNGLIVFFDDEDIVEYEGVGKVRRPSTKSLIKKLCVFGNIFQDPRKAKEYMYEAISTSPKVNLEERQSRAYALMLQEAKQRKENSRIFLRLLREHVAKTAGMNWQTTVDKLRRIMEQEVLAVLQEGSKAVTADVSFVWKRSEHPKQAVRSKASLLEFVKTYRALKNNEDARLLFDTISFHCRDGAPPEGDILAYLVFLLGELNKTDISIYPLYSNIEKIAKNLRSYVTQEQKEAEEIEDEYEREHRLRYAYDRKRYLTHEILDSLEQIVLEIVLEKRQRGMLAEVFNGTLAPEPTATASPRLQELIFSSI